MQDGPRKPAADPARTVRFREVARDIVAKDRRDRKNGLTVDTGGAIRRALEHAYREGFRDAQIHKDSLASESSVGGPMRWVMIPPRPRSAFWSICLFVYGQTAEEEREGYLIPDMTEKGTPGWRLVIPSWKNNQNNTIGEKTITALVKLGLLEASANGADRLVVSKLGTDTWRFFCKLGGRFPEDLRKPDSVD